MAWGEKIKNLFLIAGILLVLFACKTESPPVFRSFVTFDQVLVDSVLSTDSITGFLAIDYFPDEDTNDLVTGLFSEEIWNAYDTTNLLNDSTFSDFYRIEPLVYADTGVETNSITIADSISASVAGQTEPVSDSVSVLNTNSTEIAFSDTANRNIPGYTAGLATGINPVDSLSGAGLNEQGFPLNQSDLNRGSNTVIVQKEVSQQGRNGLSNAAAAAGGALAGSLLAGNKSGENDELEVLFVELARVIKAKNDSIALLKQQLYAVTSSLKTDSTAVADSLLVTNDSLLSDTSRVLTFEEQLIRLERNNANLTLAGVNTKSKIDNIPETEDPELRKMKGELLSREDSLYQLRLQLAGLSTLYDTASLLSFDTVMVVAFYRIGQTVPYNRDTVFSVFSKVKMNPALRGVFISGYTDRSGNPQINKIITNKRLQYLQSMMEESIPVNMIYFQNFGDRFASQEIVNEERRLEIRFLLLRKPAGSE